jgi:hypothetical protein
MSDDPIALKAEIERLRELLINNDIDPDPAPPEAEQFGPPTEWQWRMQQMFAASAGAFAKHATEVLLREPRWINLISPEGEASKLRIRAPTKFEVRP